MKNYYSLLDLTEQATAEQIKKAYKKKALQYHPDRNQNDKKAEEKFKQITEAYQVLSDPHKKKVYDIYGEQGLKSNGHYQQKVNMDDMLRDFRHIFTTNRFDGFFTSHNASDQEDLNVYLKIKITLQESAVGVTKKIRVNHFITCSDCGGNGADRGTSIETCGYCLGTGQEQSRQKNMFIQIFSSKPCSQCKGEGKNILKKCRTCKGEGRKKNEETITLKIPAGVTQGMQITKTGKGHAPVRGGSPGDLVILVEELPDEQLKREGLHIRYECVISLLEAMTGTEKKIPTLIGHTKIKIPPGTQSGSIIILEREGLPQVKNDRIKGNQNVHIHVWTPQNVSSDTKKAFKKLVASDPAFKAPDKLEQGDLSEA